MLSKNSVSRVLRTRGLAVGCGLIAVFATTAAGATAAPSAHGVSGAYEKRMKVPGKELRGLLVSIPKVTAIGFRYPVAPTAARTAATGLRAAEVTLKDATKRLKTISPPSVVMSEHAELMAGATHLATELKPIIVRLDKGYLNEISTLPSLLGMRQIASALTALKHDGYQFGT
jgi:hypothetical protein